MVKKIDEPVQLYYVAMADGVLTEEFAQWRTSSLTDKDLTEETARGVWNYARERQLPFEELQPDGSGYVFFAPLEEGFYLICSAAEKAEFAPFLVHVPTVIGDRQVYDIEATPKQDSEPDPTIPGETEPPPGNIPQTGHIQWPKYLLLILGGILILVGMEEVLRGWRKHHE